MNDRILEQDTLAATERAGDAQKTLTNKIE